MRSERVSTAWRIVVAICVSLPLPVGYVLGIGPAARLVSREQLSVEAYSMFYAPLFWCRRSPVCQQLLESYVDLWLGP